MDEKETNPSNFQGVIILYVFTACPAGFLVSIVIKSIGFGNMHWEL